MKGFQITITAEDHDEMRTKIAQLAQLFGVQRMEATPQMELPLKAEVEEPELPQAESEPKATKRRGRPKKAESEEVLTSEDKALADAMPSEPVTREMAFSGLQQLVGLPNGMETARSILSKFKCARISELKEEDYGRFVKACSDVVRNTERAEALA